MILIFVASLNENMKLAKKVKEQLQENGKESEIINLVELNLPMYDSNKEEKDGIPSSIKPIIEKMKSCDSYVFISPEYNFSLPPVLVNFVAWISRVGNDFRELFSMKKVQLATHSGSFGSDVTACMRSQFTKLGAVVMPREIITTYQNGLNEESSKKILSTFASF
ncbi:NADPH-dependent FMN reductase [Arcobacter sp. CECT 8983]|uniref:NADPH-dependent FMN reductase n=1 Tax=Arcobacter sp. CECT 8983 TaxID=2044508 RepID=UPI00100B7A70|nr:NAD(P)H-dependent oxidoreductase [Arcobacter sp. CECT 8983]RXJ91771.1 NADPH-dependent FMN reductase [Arcobacter sp. CECT 8983]